MIYRLRVPITFVLAFAHSAASGANCGTLPCGSNVTKFRHYSVDGATVEAIRPLAPIRLPSPWKYLDRPGLIQTLAARHDYLLFHEKGGTAVVDLGAGKALDWIIIQVGSQRELNQDRLGNCWPHIPRRQQVLFLSNEDAGQIFYKLGHWRIEQCGD